MTKSDTMKAADIMKENEMALFINSEYKRGYMEGQMNSIKQFAGFLDSMVEKYNTIALSHRLQIVKVPLPPA